MAPGPMNYASAHEAKQEDKALRELRLEGSVVLKIVKHCQESQPFLVTGQLLGLDIGSSLEVTDCFPFPVSQAHTKTHDHIPDRTLRIECASRLTLFRFVFRRQLLASTMSIYAGDDTRD